MSNELTKQNIDAMNLRREDVMSSIDDKMSQIRDDKMSQIRDLDAEILQKLRDRALLLDHIASLHQTLIETDDVLDTMHIDDYAY